MSKLNKNKNKMDGHQEITIKDIVRRTCSLRTGHSASLDCKNKSNDRLSRTLIILLLIVNLCIIVNSEQLTKRRSIDSKQSTIKSSHHKLIQNQIKMLQNNNRASIVQSSLTPYSIKRNSTYSVDKKIISNSLTLPKPSSLQQSSQNDCPVLPSNQSPSIHNSTTQQMCTCYSFDDGIYIECDSNVPVHIIRLTLSLLKEQQLIAIERFQISYSTMRSLNEILFRGMENSLKQLSITNGQLRTIPQNSLKQLKSLETLDLDTNQIDQLDSYAFYGLPLTVLSLQSNKLHTLLEYSFGGLEHTLEELILMHNSLKTFPLVALRRLRKLKNLKLTGNLINELTDDGFTRFTALQNLDLSNNKLTSLNIRSLITMPKLVTLSFASNRLSSLSESPFIYLLELETLDLSHNAIRTIGDKVFLNLGNLRTLDLSANHLHSLPPHMLHPLMNLRELYLSKNNLLHLSNQTFQNNTQIQALFVSHNSLPEIQPGIFNHLTSMQQLHLSFNSLRDLQGNLFKHNSALRTLALDNNLIANLHAGCFQELVELRDLRLQRNLLKRVERGVFYSFPSLQELDLEYNRIELLEQQALQSLVNLQYLNLQGNRLIEVGDSLLSSFPSSLKHVQLNHNQITNIHKGGLKGQTQLEVIWINHNKLQKLTTGIFNDLHNCQKLYVQYNELATIEPGVFQNMGQLVYLNLEHNNLAQLNIDMFKGANQLNELHLAHNHIMDLEVYAFSSLPSLRFLSLDNNQIYVLRKNVFDTKDFKSKNNLPIDHLSLSNVMIEELEMDTFNTLKQLKSLDISENNLNLAHLNLTDLRDLIELNLRGNNMKLPIEELCKAGRLEQLDASNTRLTIKQLDKILTCLPNLKKLILNENDLGQFKMVDSMNRTELRDFKTIEQLYLERNQFSVIPLSTMHLFSNLKHLSLAGNSIKQVFKSELQYSKELKLLNLSSNGLSVLDAQCFQDLGLLTVLDLSNNVMRSLPPNIFIGLNNLEELLLSGNWFQHIPNNLFATGLTNLRTLSFNHNPLQRVREDLSVIGGFTQLINLNLANCSLSIIASHDFFGLPSLMTLNLKNNHITKISPGSFRPLQKLTTLDLQNNELEILPEERLSGLSELVTLNLTVNHLLEMPVFSRDLKKLKNLDFSHNKLTRVDTLGNLASSLENLNLRGNMITWIDKSAFNVNLTSLKVLDLSKNHLTHFSELIFNNIEVTLERFSLSGNPIHCDCRLLSLWEWLQEHSRLIVDENELHCVQPEKQADLPVLSVHPIDFCPVPMIVAIEVEQIEHNQITIRWEIQRNGTELVGGFTLDYHHTEDRFPLVINRQLSATDRSIDIMNLNSTTLYTICVQANDHQRTHFNDFVTSNRKCIQVRTLDYSKRIPIQISTFSLIVIAGTISGVFLMCIIVCLLGIKYRRRRTSDSSQKEPENISKISNELPEEFTISYRNFSLPSTENVYS